MSFLISKAAAQVATTTITYDLKKLGPRQRKSLARMLSTGVVKGDGIPAKIADIVLKQKGLPYIRVYARGYVTFDNIPLDKTHPLREGLFYAHALHKLEEWGKFKDNSPWIPQRELEKLETLESRTSSPWTYFSRSSIKAFDTVDMHYDIPLGDTVEVTL